MIKFLKDDMWSYQAQIRVNTVNCKGVMGKGVALQFKEKLPACFEPYREWCASGKARPGHVMAVHLPECIVVHAATKDHWKYPSRLSWIETIVLDLWSLLHKFPGATVTIPPLG